MPNIIDKLDEFLTSEGFKTFLQARQTEPLVYERDNLKIIIDLVNQNEIKK